MVQDTTQCADQGRDDRDETHGRVYMSHADLADYLSRVAELSKSWNM